MKRVWIRSMILLIGLTMLLIAQNGYPKLYDSVGDDLYAAADGYALLSEMENLRRIHREVGAFVTQAEALKKTGLELDAKSSAEGYSVYLADLRALSKQKHALDARYLRLVRELKMRQIEVDLITLRQNPYPLIRDAATDLELPKQDEVEKIETSAMNMHASLEALKAQLMHVREDGNETMIGCLNDVTAINYWVLEVEKHQIDEAFCKAYSATGHIVDFERSAKRVCGSEHPLYVQWKEHSLSYRTSIRKRLKEACAQQ